MKPKEKRERKLKSWILKYIRNLKKLPKDEWYKKHEGIEDVMIYELAAEHYNKQARE